MKLTNILEVHLAVRAFRMWIWKVSVWSCIAFFARPEGGESEYHFTLLHVSLCPGWKKWNRTCRQKKGHEKDVVSSLMRLFYLYSWTGEDNSWYPVGRCGIYLFFLYLHVEPLWRTSILNRSLQSSPLLGGYACSRSQHKLLCIVFHVFLGLHGPSQTKCIP